MSLPALNNRKPAPSLFLHIQKTAGTSFIEVARRHYGNSLTSHGDCWGHLPEEFKDVLFVSGHFGYDFASRLMADRFSFTFLRNPMERVLSMYYFCRNRNPNEFMIYKRANELDLEGFLRAGTSDPWVKKNIWNNQVWQLAHGYAHLDSRTLSAFGQEELLTLAKEHLEELNYVGFTETIDTDGPAVFSALGIPNVPVIPKMNITSLKGNLSALSPGEKALLDELTGLDRQLYDYAWQRYSQPEHIE